MRGGLTVCNTTMKDTYLIMALGFYSEVFLNISYKNNGGGGLTVCICLRVKIGKHLNKVLCWTK